MKHFARRAACLLAFYGLATYAIAGNLPKGTVIVPKSSIQRPEDAGKRAHTNVIATVPFGTPTTPGGFFETPASLACVYHLVKHVSGCNPQTVTAVPNTGWGAVVLVDAYDDPNAASDLQTFSAEFGLPAPNFQVVYQGGVQPPQDPSGGWEFEESLDIEMAHAMAPKASIYLVEAQSSGFGDLFASIDQANSTILQSSGGGSMSMSWGSGEFSGENGYDSNFNQAKVIYFSSAGDSAGVNYPSASPYVVSVGGTALSRNATTGNFELESSWASTGGGPSQYESIPSYQKAISGIVGQWRGTPDVAAVADGRTPVWVYDTFPLGGNYGNWWLASGTSVSSPLWAGIVNTAGSKKASTMAELTEIYKNLGNKSDFTDLTQGNCGNYAGYLTVKGWDFCSGVGSDIGKSGK
jgi:kumamolisin